MRRVSFGYLIGALAALLAVALPLAAVGTHFWRLASQRQFAQGRLQHLSLGPEGALMLAPALEPVLRTGQPLIWAAAVDAHGNVYLATGNAGRLYRLTPAMLHAPRPVKPSQALWFTAPEPDIFALAAGPDGAIYAATAPEGKIYRIAPDGRSQVYADLHTRYIWSLCFRGRDLYAGTGSRGEIYRITPGPDGRGVGQAFFNTGEQQVMALALDPGGDLLAGTDPGGLIFRITPAGRGFVLYNAPLGEVAALAVGPRGAIYAAAQGPVTPAGAAAMADDSGHSSADAPPGVTVVAEAAPRQPSQSGGLPGGGDGGAQVTISMGPVQVLPPDSPPPVAPPPSRGLRSAIYRIAPDGSVAAAWTSHSQDVGALWLGHRDPPGGGLDAWFATDRQGRIYRLDANRQATLLAQTGEQQTTRLFSADGLLLATTSNLGSLYRVSNSAAPRGTFLSPIKDTGAISHWGHLDWQAENAPAGAVVFQTRSGNSARPNAAWSPWSAPLTQPSAAITSPPARYIQWRATFHRGAEGTSARLDSVTLPYLPANHSPVLTQVQALTAAGQPPEAAENPKTRLQGIHLTWAAHDPDGDPLTYDVAFQMEGETAWTPLKSGLRAEQWDIAPGRLPDGIYKFKVTASDADANPPALAKTASIISAPATMDTAPPRVRLLSAHAVAGGAVAHFTASDPVAELHQAQCAIDGGPWRQLYADTGIIDSRREAFTVRAAHLAPGQHVLMLRVYDRGGNRGSAAALVTVP
ncbi:MAG: hypothetical protein ACRD2E_10560 [Terriglobales bacterium]